MKRDHDLERMFDFLETQQVTLSARQREQVVKYVELLLGWSQKINLISKGDLQHIIERHILVSFYYVYLIGVVGNLYGKRLLDLGSGAGFPGVLFSVCFPENEIWLLDSSRKKSLFLKAVVNNLGLDALPVCERIENISIEKTGRFDIVVARAVAHLVRLDQWGKRVLRAGGSLYTLKGENYSSEDHLNEIDESRIYPISITQSWKKQSTYFNEKTMIKLEY